ncbi:MAG: sensor domain-containing phosphodiesterase [Leptospirillia bacterium]
MARSLFFSRWVDLLVVGTLLLSGGGIALFEEARFGEAKAQVAADGERTGLEAAGRFSDRLSQRFLDLGFIAASYTGRASGVPGRTLRREVRVYLALHPALVDFEVRKGEAGPILWSTRAGGGPPLRPGGRSSQPDMPLPSAPTLRMGSVFASSRIGAWLLPLGILIPSSPLYVRTHVRMDTLLSAPAESPFLVRMGDSRDLPPPSTSPGQGASATSLRVFVPSYPFFVEISWPEKTAFLRYRQAALSRWWMEFGALLLLSLMGGGIRLLSRRQGEILRDFAELTALDGAIFEGAGAIGLVMGEDGRIIRMNRPAREFMGVPGGPSENVPDEPYYWEQFLPEEEVPGVHELFRRMKTEPAVREYDNHWLRPSGERRLFRWTLTAIDEGGIRYIVKMGVDITEGERLTGLLREKNDQLAGLLSYNVLRGKLAEAVSVASEEGPLLETFCALSIEVPRVVLAWVGRPDEATGEFSLMASAGVTGYLEGFRISAKEDELTGQGIAGQAWRSGESIYNSSFAKNKWMAPWQERAASFGIEASATVPVRREGRLYALLTVYLDCEETFSPELREILDAIGASLSLGLDRIDLRNREREARALSEALLSNSAAGIDLVRYPDRVVVEANEAFLRIFGFAKRDEIVGQSVRSLYFDDEGFVLVGGISTQALAEGVAFAQNVSFRRRSDGKRMWADIAAHRVPGSARSLLVWTVVDVTEKHRLEGELEEVSRFRNLLAQVGRMMAERREEDGLFQEICEMSVRYAEFDLAWAGVPGKDGRIRFVGRAGETGYLDGLSITVDETLPEGNGPAGSTWRSQEPSFNLDFDKVFSGGPRAKRAARFGFRSLALLPISRSGSPWGLLAFYLKEEGGFDASLQALLRELVDLISGGLDRLDEERRLRILSNAIASVGEGVSITDPSGDVLFVNEAFTAITGYSFSEMAGKNCRILQGRETDSSTVAAIREAIRAGAPIQCQIRNYKKDGSPFWNMLSISPVHDDAGRVVEFVGVQRDVSEVVEISRLLEHEALHDRLTGLPNRRSLDQAFERAFGRSKRYKWPLAVVMIDLDGFKPVNDTFGHEAGDRLLVAIGERLSRVLRKTDFLARLGGDEFVLLVENYAGSDEFLEVLRRVEEAATGEFRLPGGESLHVGISLGVAIDSRERPETPPVSPDALLRLADLALYESKAHKADREVPWVVYGEGVRIRKNEAQRLLADGALEVFYQPILSVATQAVVGVEALARLKAADGKMLLPEEFLGDLSSGDLFELSRQVIERVLGAMPRLLEVAPDLWVSVNIDPGSVTEKGVEVLRRMLEGAKVSPSRLFFEILEAREFGETKDALELLHQLKGLCVRLAMDDVGSAYSSLLRLKELPVDKVKLDQGFILTIESNPRDLHFVGAVQELVSRMGLSLVVEGVESESILDAMEAMGIDLLQGYAISVPLPFEGILTFLQGFPREHHPYPRTLFGLYAISLSLHGRMSRSVRQSPSLFDPRLLSEVLNCPVEDALERVGIDRDSEIESRHEDYHRQMAYYVRSFKNYGTVTEVVDREFARAGEAMLESILAEYRKRSGVLPIPEEGRVRKED